MANQIDKLRAAGIDPIAYAKSKGISTSPTAQTINQGPAAVRAKIQDYEERALMYARSGDTKSAERYAGALWELYKSDPSQYEGRMGYITNAFQQGFQPLGFEDWKVGQQQQYVDSSGNETSTKPDDYTGPEYIPVESWREMTYPKQWQMDLAREGGDVALELMAMQNAMQGRSAAVDMLEGWDTQVQDTLGGPVISPEDEAQMLAQSSGTLAQSYQNQALGAQMQMGARGIDPRSGVSQELMAALRFNTLAQQANQEIGTKLENKQINRSALERAIGLRSGIRGGIADLIAGQPLAATSMAASAAGLISAQRGLEMGQMSPAQGALQGGLAGVTAGAGIAPPWGAIIGGLGGAAAGYFSNK